MEEGRGFFSLSRFRAQWRCGGVGGAATDLVCLCVAQHSTGAENELPVFGAVENARHRFYCISYFILSVRSLGGTVGGDFQSPPLPPPPSQKNTRIYSHINHHYYPLELSSKSPLHRQLRRGPALHLPTPSQRTRCRIERRPGATRNSFQKGEDNSSVQKAGRGVAILQRSCKVEM